MIKLTRPMLNRLTLPQLQQLAEQYSIPLTDNSEKAWIVEDVLEAQESPQAINLQQMHDELLKEEKATGGDRHSQISHARQLIKCLL
jgi:hypothetical protein